MSVLLPSVALVLALLVPGVAAPAATPRHAELPLYHSALPSTPARLDTLYNRLHRPLWGGEFSGVAQLEIQHGGLGGTSCSGALLGGGRFVLTAAHCLSESGGLDGPVQGKAWFPTRAEGRYTGTLQAVSFSSAQVHPDWDGDFLRRGNDIALLRLDAPAPPGARRYALYEDGDEVGRVATKVGWGQYGTGEGDALGFGWRMGHNLWDATASAMSRALGGGELDSVLQYDFDNGLARNDAFGFFFGLEQRGVAGEVLSGPGDSGGPSFIDGRIAGITSYAVRLFRENGSSSDLTPLLDSSFGEFGGDTRVSAYLDWIHAAMVPEPPPALSLAAGLLVLLAGKALRRPGRWPGRTWPAAR